MATPVFEIASGETIAIPLQIRNALTKVGLNISGLSIEVTGNTERSPKDTVNQVFKKVPPDVVTTDATTGKITIVFTLVEWAAIGARGVIYVDVWGDDGSGGRQRLVKESDARLDQPINQG